MVEPLEETRSELTFATEPILSSLELSIPGSGRNSALVELDEVEVFDTSLALLVSPLNGLDRYKKAYFKSAKDCRSFILPRS